MYCILTAICFAIWPILIARSETVFNIPGLARFLVESIRNRDYPIVQNLVMLTAFIVVSINFAVDLLYAALDPRIRLGA